MKKLISAALVFALLFAFAGCAGKQEADGKSAEKQAAASSAVFPETVINTNEYIIYQNIFYNNQGKDYAGKEVVKKGIFTVLYDKYSDVDRYYVWGYNDQTMCCDWQWELSPEDKENLPSPGSKVTVEGVLEYDDDALDKYIIKNASVKAENEFKDAGFDVDMATMDGTLERVQVASVLNHSDKFEGKTIRVYGRIQASGYIQHPYYDKAFSFPFEYDGEMLPIGTPAIVTGTFSEGTIKNAVVTEYAY